jgi:hypothetical protein
MLSLASYSSFSLLSPNILTIPYSAQAKQPKGKDQIKPLPATIEQTSLSLEEVSSFKNLVRDEGYYMLRVGLVSQDVMTSTPAMTSVPACSLIQSNFRDRIGIYFNRNGDIISLSYQTRVENCNEKTGFYLYCALCIVYCVLCNMYHVVYVMC